ncbi:asparagine synthase (glutamine-hydrolyzing) [Mucilaginibacter sp. dw_454]|uniref:asparagine synthase (glutamine-hydrolyzing) n=1 Tax=Mucilaginibacter sp. dw_454 TaxID=2720079 RepID=UPI0021058892|nr:asparagine synthase (glutamine-hydrolyzing) [Mucilaginibacter sp. dw_454]
MCRIAGIISNKLSHDQRHNMVSLMCDALKHGGPDDEGIYSADDVNLTFGHRRLSIIDLTTNGHQPMTDVNRKAWITYNGEIYNYPELRSQLIKEGATFHSDTDTEVIVQAYLYWGTKAFSMLRGMFAFALYDAGKALTYLVRDTTGIKPLYYHIDGGQLSFASEVKAIKAAGITMQENPQWAIKFLAYGHIPEPYTTLNNVYSLVKGEMLCWNHQNSSAVISAYGTTARGTAITNLADAHAAIEHSLKTAVKRQLIADAPIGVFLSGGIDSSLITLLAEEQKHQDLKTVSIFFDEDAYDERAFQQKVFEQIGGEKFTHLVRQQDFNQFFPDALDAMDMPTTDGINSWFISKYAHQDGLKAVLSGIGADELFGGYPSFNRIAYIKYLRSLPNTLIKTFTNVAPDRYKRAMFLTQKHAIADYLFLRGLFTPPDIAALLNCDESQVYQALFSDEDKLNIECYNQETASWFETNLYMQNQLLRDTDIMSMNHGLEVRVPFLDEDFQQTVNSIAPQLRFAKNQPKKILITTFRNILPKAVWDRPKMGFSFPLQQWMRNHPAITDLNLYNSNKGKSIITLFNKNKIHWSKAFALYQIQRHV